MAEGDRAAVDVDPALIPLQYPANRDRLSGKGLIGFDQIDVVQPPAGPLQTATGGMHRGNAHQRRIDADAGEGADPRKDRQPQLQRFSLAHHHYRRRAVIDA